MALTLYHVDWCPECALVRDRLAELGVPYQDVVVPDVRPMRKQVYDVSGQYFVPVLKDGETVLSETHEILAHLDTHYAKTAS
ncbi:glutathione S-transferase N-terminal domain-containing protein [Nitrospira moscoviensis]|uniref:Putative Glutaredoxin n=1 Tax=Nitrospira moscoviensis TaxID=42253 RepID=A0A0K2GIN2_NITMO|nr:glutathione S-transferase N-terminal domain-containing protein [Nitrospira moscoviensis]ALA60462.1 putative Glutaredoxin [Nitrospira moscoviensis]